MTPDRLAAIGHVWPIFKDAGQGVLFFVSSFRICLETALAAKVESNKYTPSWKSCFQPWVEVLGSGVCLFLLMGVVPANDQASIHA